jgi:hypothetical protein
MSSIVERLTEGVVNRDMRAESHALLSKWKKTGLLEGLEGERQANSMARLLENQAKELLRESTSMSSGDVEGFAAVAFPIVRRVFAGLIANDLVSVQPMSLPSGLIFFLDFTFSGDLGESGSQDRRFGNVAAKSIYGTDQVGSQVTGGVDLVDSRGGDLSGPRSSARGYAYASPSGSAILSSSATAFSSSGWEIGAETAAQRKAIQFDPDVMQFSGSSTAHYILELQLPKAAAQWTSGDWGDLDYDNLSAIDVMDLTDLDDITDGGGAGYTSSNTSRLRRLTQVTDTLVKLYFLTTVDTTATADGTGDSANLNVEFPIVDQFQAGANTSLGAVRGDTPWGLEGNADIPEIDIKVDSIAVTAQTKKLKAKWTPELGQDLNAYHNLDAEVELTSLLSEQIALEIDREILADLVNGATAGTRYWSRAPGLFVDSNGNEIGASAKAPDFTGTVSEWYETLVETINDVSAQIHRKTLRGGANFVVCGPEVANILEFTAGFRASVTHTDEKGSIGALKVGSLSKKFDVIVDPYFLRNVILVGRRGSSFLESGYVYAPYVPLQTTPTIFGPEDFVPRKGVMTRYAKKMVRPDMYGLVVVRGLLGESGS